LPIFVSVDTTPDDVRRRREAIRRAYNVADGDLFVVTGSRLIPEKGFDLLIRAIDNLPAHVRCRTKLLLVGRGPEETALREQARRCGLADAIHFSDWMEHDEFMGHLGAADVVVHPARFDAYGGITLSAMVAGMPLIASRGAGAAADRVAHGHNGWLYDANDVTALAHWLEVAFADRATLARLGQNARATAEAFAPERGVRWLVSNLV
jgi:glycosyltransferase involved in cell wall biosynthesis